MHPELFIEHPKTSLDFLQSELINDVCTSFDDKNQLKIFLKNRINNICEQFRLESINPYEYFEKTCYNLGSYLDEYFRFLITASDMYLMDSKYPPKEERFCKYVLRFDIKRLDYLMFEGEFDFHLKLNIDTVFGSIYIEYPYELTIEDYIKQLEPCIKRESNRAVERVIKEYYDRRK